MAIAMAFANKSKKWMKDNNTNMHTGFPHGACVYILFIGIGFIGRFNKSIDMC